ncbi:single-stranded DNA-binding protein [Paucibacter sp. DJ2R-2]|uniref:single-stranded DNA-binding protein n=1 Tax=Paucibacter sp. DJ2R-2 TaxID=2893558 RepID=UPI0021E45A11|nr:single-stranded DNA-binding protein [Paucibacter sp. DJ2R-2]MCV2438705.1 single-stranded DNA-binding protein [Paucibacter sp. DJ2R-2]
MASVRVEQRNAHLAAPVRLDFVNRRDGKLARAVLTAISNTRHGSGDERKEECTAVQWTLWGKQAEHAAEYLGKGSHVNVVGRLRNNNYHDDAGADVYAMAFTCEEIDYLDTRASAQARQVRAQEGEGWGESSMDAPAQQRRRNANQGSASRKPKQG